MVCFTKATWSGKAARSRERARSLETGLPTTTNCFTRWHFDKFPAPHYRHICVCVCGAPTGSNVSWYLSEMLICLACVPYSIALWLSLSFSFPFPFSYSFSSPIFVHTINFPLVFRPTCSSCSFSCCCCCSRRRSHGVVGIYHILCALKLFRFVEPLMSCVIG